MRKIKPTTQVPSQFLKRITDNLRDGRVNKNRTNYAAVKDEVESRFKTYNSLLVPMVLERLSPYNGFTPEQRTSIHNLYESGAKEFDALWDELKKENGGSRLRCPICGVSFAKELDHYAPREVFPEFSANPLNIIPLCHDCNHEKGVKWKDKTGYRLIFNAYFDELSDKKLLRCEISQIVDDLPLAEVCVCNVINMNDADKRATETIRALNLVDFYNDHVNRDLGTEVAQLQDDFRTNAAKYADAQAFWQDRKNTYASYLISRNKYTEERLLLYEALTTSPVFDAWIVANM